MGDLSEGPGFAPTTVSVAEPGKYYSPRIKKGITKVGESFDSARKAVIGLAGLSSIHLANNHIFLIDLSKVDMVQSIDIGIGLFLIVVGIYWQAEAEI